MHIDVQIENNITNSTSLIETVYFSNLDPNVEYEITITPYTIAGRGPASPPIFVSQGKKKS